VEIEKEMDGSRRHRRSESGTMSDLVIDTVQSPSSLEVPVFTSSTRRDVVQKEKIGMSLFEKKKL